MDDIHDLTAPYALDALDGPETEAFEKHLRHCEDCRAEVAMLRETASLLAHDAPPVEPPPELRERILASARAERGNVIPFRQRFAAPIAAAAAVAACAALALGVWAGMLKNTVGDREAALRSQARALAVAASPGARQIPLSGGHGSLVVAPGGRAALILSGLPKPPPGKVFVAWVMRFGLDALIFMVKGSCIFRDGLRPSRFRSRLRASVLINPVAPRFSTDSQSSGWTFRASITERCSLAAHSERVFSPLAPRRRAAGPLPTPGLRSPASARPT